jgi:hypothetical protein
LKSSNDSPSRNEQKKPFRQSPAALGVDSRPESGESSSGDQKVTTPMLVPGKQRGNTSTAMEYGSFVATPPSSSRPPEFVLPDPAIDSTSEEHSPRDTAPIGGPRSGRNSRRQIQQRSASISAPASAYEVGQTSSPPHRSTFASIRLKRHPFPRHSSTSGVSPGGTVGNSPRLFLQRMLSNASPLAKGASKGSDVDLNAIDQVRARQKLFFTWMDTELEKIETFYQEKEDEAGERLKILRDQLHEMRDRRIEEIAYLRKDRAIRREDENVALSSAGIKLPRTSTESKRNSVLPSTRESFHAWTKPFEKALESAKSQTLGPRPGHNSQALINMGLSTNPTNGNGFQPGRSNDPGNDYTRKKPHHEHEVPYRTAKRKLKLALKEYYRGLELLKSFALLNRTAFRKINKKYDKAVNAHPPLRYMSEKVNKAWFVKSDVLEGHLHAVEDLYARYFESGNHKIAIGKLRSANGRPGQYTGTIFRTGVLIGVGAVFAIQGLTYGAEILLHDPDPVIRTQASYLLQIYAGYFLALYLFTFFTLNCEIWNRNKINYVFIFELDPRSHLDWRELAEFPAALILLLGLFLWINFSNIGAPVMFIYYPVILIFVTTLIIFLPAPVLFHRSRLWFVYSHVSGFKSHFQSSSLTVFSGACCSPDCTLWSSETFFWETYSVL